MSRRTVALLIAIAASSAMCGIAQTNQIKIVPLTATSPASGEQMYGAYCAVCHGVDGKGNGPAASALKSAPTDLTVLAKDNGGKFPQGHVESVLRFGVATTTAHGSKDMPTWGPALQSLSTGSETDHLQQTQRIANLTRYLRNIQQ